MTALQLFRQQLNQVMGPGRESFTQLHKASACSSLAIRSVQPLQNLHSWLTSPGTLRRPCRRSGSRCSWRIRLRFSCYTAVYWWQVVAAGSWPLSRAHPGPIAFAYTPTLRLTPFKLISRFLKLLNSNITKSCTQVFL